MKNLMTDHFQERGYDANPSPRL